MNFEHNTDNDIVKGLESELSSQGQAHDASDQAEQAFTLAQTQAKDKYRPEEPEYWPYVTQLSNDLLGIEQAQDRPIIQPTGTEPTAQSLQPSRPLMMGDSKDQQKSGGYPNYGESVRRVDMQSKDTDDLIKAIDWITQAKELVKDMKKAKVSEENIIFALVNRVGLSPDTAKLFYDGKYKEELDEDNAYNHMTITTRSGYPYEAYGMESNRDAFEWEMSSTRYVAKALAVDGRYSYECRFEILQSDTARWPHPWNFLKDHDVHHVLKVSINQLNANTNYMRLTPDSAPIAMSSESNLLKTMKAMFASYNKVFGSTLYQLVVLGTSNIDKLHFLLKVAKEFEKTSGIKVSEEISTEMTEKATEDTAQRNMLYIALTNSRGAKIKEGEESGLDFMDEAVWDEETTSAAFAATPFDAKHDFRKDGEALNAEAEESLRQMGIELL